MVSFAIQGRIDSVFLKENTEILGHGIGDTAKVRSEKIAGEKLDDLTEDAAVHTILNGGNAYALTSHEIPADQVVAAITCF